VKSLKVQPNKIVFIFSVSTFISVKYVPSYWYNANTREFKWRHKQFESGKPRLGFLCVFLRFFGKMPGYQIDIGRGSILLKIYIFTKSFSVSNSVRDKIRMDDIVHSMWVM
jgi:hypothetical protein